MVPARVGLIPTCRGTLWPLRQSSDRVGFIVAGADDSTLARKLAAELADSVRFTIEDAPAGRLPGLWSLT